MPSRKRRSAAGATTSRRAGEATARDSSAPEAPRRPVRHESATLPRSADLQEAAGIAPSAPGSASKPRPVRCPSAPRMRAERDEQATSTIPLGKVQRDTWPYDDEELARARPERLPDTERPGPFEPSEAGEPDDVAASPTPPEPVPSAHPAVAPAAAPRPSRLTRPRLRSGVFDASWTAPPSYRRPPAPTLPRAERPDPRAETPEAAGDDDAP